MFSRSTKGLADPVAEQAANGGPDVALHSMPADGAAINRQIVLARRPDGLPKPEDFALVPARIPEPQDGQVLLRHSWLGLAPAARLRMGAADSYAKPLALGEVVYGQAVGVVIESRNKAFVSGDTAVAMRAGWQEYSVAGGESLSKVHLDIAPPSVWLGALGTSGMTAYVGLLDFGRPQAGETVLVSAASGAVGSSVGQIAKLKGCRAVGIAGGELKCRLAEDLGFDTCVDYRAPDFPAQLARACPQGVHVYFENVGGSSRQAALPLMAVGGRIVLCGLISEYNDAQEPGPGWFPMLTKRLSLRGFILSDHLDRRADFEREMSSWYASGKVKVREDISQGLEQTVPAFIRMLQGKNFGKTLVRL